MSSVITTDFERWKAQEAALGKPVALNEFVFANVPGLDPSKDISRDEKLPPSGQIVHRQAVNKAGLASENAVAYSVTLGTDTGDFVFNWIGLINKESGTLAMITHAPEQRKIKTVDGVQGNVLTRSFLLEFNGAAKETQITTSAETWQIDFTARLAGMDEIRRLANRDIYGAAAFFGDGFLATKAAEQYRVTPGTAYIEGLRGTLEEITTFNNLRDTKIYADFTFQGNLVSKWQTFVKVTTAKTLTHYQDAAGFQHYVAVIAEIDQNGNITDKRVKGTAIDRELAELKKELPIKYQPIGDYQPAGNYQPAGSYQPAGNYVDSDYFRLEMLKKFDKTGLSDQMGNDSSKAPSLRLFTEEIGKKQPKGDYALKSDVAGLIKPGFTMFAMQDEKDIMPPWYSINGDRYGIDTPQGKVLRAFPADLKKRWNIVETSQTITLPTVLQPDGRMPFPRPVNGTGRLTGSVVGDMIRNFTGELGYEANYGLTTSERDVAGAFRAYGASKGAFKGGGEGRTTNVMFDPSTVVPTGAENKPLDVGATWIVYLGV